MLQYSLAVDIEECKIAGEICSKPVIGRCGVIFNRLLVKTIERRN